jgi:DNA-directed RNA polymerase specialized sigma24 family protein
MTPAEFESLLAHWRGMAVKVAMRDTRGDYALADDLVQDASIKLWEKVGDGKVVTENEDHFRALLCLFAHREWQHHIGRARARHEALLAEVDEGEFTLIADSVNRSPSAESVVLDWLGGPAVAALRHVNPPGRVILVRMIVQGCSAEDICQEFGYSTVGKAWHAITAARAELRAAYGEVMGIETPKPKQRNNADTCVAGHPWSEENTKLRVGRNGRTQRECRACHREYMRARKQQGHERERNREYGRDRYWRLKQAELKHRIDPDDLLAIVHA